MAKLKVIQLKEVLTLEMLGWLLIGLVFGWFAGKGASFLLIAIPIAIFAVWAIDYLHKRAL